MFESILVAVDGSEQSWQAVDQAIEVARREGEGTVLHGLYVVDAALTTADYEFLAAEAMEVEASLKKRGWQVLEEFTRRVKAAGMQAQTQLAEGEVGRTICERAGLADLVAIGREGAGGATARLLFGSTFEAVVRYSPRPVLVAVGPARPLRRVLLAYDGSQRAKDALEVVAQVARTRGIEVTALTVTEPGRAGEDTISGAVAYLQEHGVGPKAVLLSAEHPASAILRVADREDVDLVVLGGYGHGRFLELLFGHTVDEVVRGTTRPLLICR